MILSHNCTTARPQSLALKLSLSSLFLFFCLALFTTKQKTSHAQNTGVFSIISKTVSEVYGSTLRSYGSIYFALTRCNTKKGAGAALRRHGPAALVRITKDLTLLTSAASPSHSQLPPLRPPRPPASSPPASSCHPACHRAAAKMISSKSIRLMMSLTCRLAITKHSSSSGTSC